MVSAPIRRLLSRRVVKPADNKAGKKKLRELSRKMLRDKALRELAVKCKGLDSDISSRQESCQSLLNANFHVSLRTLLFCRSLHCVLFCFTSYRT